MSKGGDYRDAVPVERIWDLHDLIDQSAGVVSALQKIQLRGKIAGIDVSTTV